MEQIAKITRPNPTGTYKRERLLNLLDGERGRAVIWISAPAGAGKTTLLSNWLDSRRIEALWYRTDTADADPPTFFHYLGLAASAAAPRKKTPLPALTPEYLPALSVFTRRFFEAFFQRFKPGSVVVIDDFHAAASPVFVEIIKGMIDTLLPGIRLVVISREDIPAEYSRLKVNGDISLISWPDMRFTLEETRGLLRHRHGDDAGAENIHEAAGGWAAGLALMERIGASAANRELTESRDELFRYFMTEVMGEIDEELRDFLLKTALFPEFTEAVAEEMTASGKARSLIGSLVKKNFFIERYQGNPVRYRYHQLFREFLTVQAMDYFSAEDRAGFCGSAAQILARNRDPASAFRLFIEAGQPLRALDLLLAEAPSLLGQGRNKTLIEKFDQLPAPLLRSQPPAIFWKGLALQPFDPPAARQHFADAFSAFRDKNDFTGMLRCWCNLVETAFHEWDNVTQLDPWIGWLTEVSKDELPIPDAVLDLQISSAMTAALTMRGGDPQEMRKWAERAIAALKPVSTSWPRLSALVYCVNYVSWVQPLDLDLGIIEKSLSEAETVELPPLLRLTTIYTRAALQIQRMPDMNATIKEVNRALSLAEEAGVHVWDEIFYGLGIYCAVILNDRAASTAFVEKMRACTRSERRQGLAFYYYVSAWHGLVFGSPARAKEEIAKALKLYAQTGYDFPSNVATYGAAVICAENKELDEALAYAKEADAVAVRYEAVSMRYTTLLILAYVHVKRAEVPEALKALAEALRIGRTGRFFQTTWWWYAPMMSVLMELALDEEIEADYAVSLIRELHIEPPSVKAIPEQWPMPVRIHTLGGFRLEIEGKLLDVSRKAQKKLMDLLKTIIALGGEGVPMERLADILWPDAEGDAAMHALETALYRLRKLLGQADIVEVRDGKAFINRKICRVDALEFFVLMSQKMPEKAIAAYKGSFLPDDIAMDCTLSMREKLRDRYLKLAREMGSAHEKKGDWEGALHLYLQGAETDPLGEEMIRGAMRALSALGRKPEAITLYERLARDLKRDIGISPSAATENLARDFRSPR